ncbi:MAG: VWA domain-containing protein [Acidimicrobiia bacterium]
MTTVPARHATMLDVLQGFVHELRAAGLPVSMTENLDAMRGVEHIELAEREVLRSVLGATLVKHHRHRAAFDTVFDVYFSLFSPAADDRDAAELPDELFGGIAGEMSGAGAGGDLSREEIAEMLLRALARMDDDELRRLAGIAVSQFAGMEPGRPVGGTYYLYRTLRQLDLEDLSARLMGQAQERGEIPSDPLGERLAREEFEARLHRLRRLVEEEIRRRLIADRGVDAMARTLRKPLPEDIDFMHASRDEMLALQRAIQPLTRLLAARLAQRRRRRHRGHLDFRRTVRASMNYGGVPAEPKFRRPHPSKPEIMVVADISGSVASFARFTLQFVHAMASQFSKVRSWVFIDGIDEVSRFFEGADDISAAVHRVNTEADVVWVDGHSDYGHAFTVFHDRHEREVTHKTSVIFLGDARNNYHASHSWVLQSLQKRARHVYWLNPEPRGYWDSGDSIISEYARFCDGVFECRNLRQLERFVTTIAEA